MKTVNVGLIGFGNIGVGVIKSFQLNAELFNEKIGGKLKLVKIADLDITTPRSVTVDSELLTNDANQILENPAIDIVIELIGGLHPAYEFVKKALKNKKSVVTANKALLAAYGPELIAIARENKVSLQFEASVGGGIPLIRTIRDGLSANNIQSLFGIVNGTCNYILTEMYSDPDKSFEDILKIAQELGYAEPDPTADIEGFDTANKAAVLASLAFNQKIYLDDVFTEGITKITSQDISYTSELGYTIKMLAIIRKRINGVEVRVHPTLLKNDHMLASINDVYNAVLIESDLVGKTMFFGPGAGPLPTASAVISDILEIAKHVEDKVLPESLTPYEFSEEKAVVGMNEIESGFYIRFKVYDRPGVLAKVADIFSKHEISIAAVTQKEVNVGGTVPLILLTHRCSESKMTSALTEVEKLSDSIQGSPFFIRIME